ncbi:MAG: PfkB family carbohydrate kinase, partial [SAR324 cluster bacterium]|nr:PfkB family carbohydrate kinase [SAR324 cluster bacterium]
NYRALLWTPEAAREAIEEILEHTGAVIAAHRDLRTLFGAPEDPEAAAREFAEAHGVPLVVLTLGDQGSLAFDGNLLRQPAFPSEPLDRIGAGDAFAAGFLHGWLAGDLARGLVLGNASAALKQTYRGDTTWATREDVLELVESGAADSRQVRR